MSTSNDPAAPPSTADTPSDGPADDSGDPRRAEWATLEARAEGGGGRARQARHERLGRMGARQRIEWLVDADSFVELGRYTSTRPGTSVAEVAALAARRPAGDGVICGLASIGGRTVAVYAHDPTVQRGALGSAASDKLVRLFDLAGQRGLPLLGLADSDGARVAEGVGIVRAYGEVLRRAVALRPRVPHYTLVCGLCAGAAAYTAALGDLVGMVGEQSFLFVTGPRVTQAVTGEDVTIDELGGRALHATRTGSCHATFEDEHAGLRWLRRLVELQHAHAASSDPVERPVPELETLIPREPRRIYDMRRVLAAVCDADSIEELSAAYAPNLLTAFARLGGRAVAVVASQPAHGAGALDGPSSRKGAHFLRLAQKLAMPVVTFVDVPGYRPGRAEEASGLIAEGAELIAAYGELTVPQVALVVRKSIGGGSVLGFSADVRLALPTAEVAPMGADAAVEVALGPLRDDADERVRAERALQRETWLAEHLSLTAAADGGYFDRIVAPADVRRVLCATLGHLEGRA